MYKNLKIILAIITLSFIAIMGFIFVKNNQSEMFSGYKQIILVNRSTVNFKSDIERIAKDNDLLIAKRIINAKNNISGKLENTYLPIGKGNLPKTLPIQKDKSIIKNSPDNTLYIIVKGNLSAVALADKLNDKNNSVEVSQTNFKLVFLRSIISIPQTFMIIIVLLITFSSLILAEYISNIRSIGIRRLSGEDKYSIALKNTYKDSVLLITFALILIFGILIGHFIYNIFSFESFMMAIIPTIIWLVVLLLLNFLLSNLFYYILQHQPIELSIKGKAPVKLIFIMVLIIQLSSLFSLMYSINGIYSINKELSSLKNGQQSWQKEDNLYQMSAIDDGDTVSKRQKKAFYDKLAQSVELIFIKNNFDSILMSSDMNKNSYLPTDQQISNVIYVNKKFMDKSNIKVSPEIKSKIDHLVPFENIILIPGSQKNNYSKLKGQWENFIKKEAKASSEDMKFSKIQPQVKSGIYSSKKRIFIYPIFNDGGQIVSTKSFAYEPIIIVGSPYSNLSMYPDAWNIRVNQPEKVVELIKKYKLTQALGSLTKGIFSINEKVKETQNKKALLIVATTFSVISSTLLLILLNKIYFYQGRKLFFIERLSGRSMVNIHKVYLGIVLGSNIFISLTCFILKFTHLVVITPVFYLILIILIFLFQLNKEKESNIQYLKGE